MKHKVIAIALLLMHVCAFSHAQTAADKWWKMPSPLHVEGNHLVDADGMNVMLHGIMDTPSPYFSGYRFTDGKPINVYTQGDSYIEKCLNYFDKLFTAATDTTQGSFCNVFRLHLDPCWTDNPNVNASGFTSKDGKVYDPNGTEVSGESNIQHFDKERLKTYLSRLFIEIALRAKKHGMYVILRPPGVCPSKVKVGDYYQQYLIDVWDIVTTAAYKTVNANSGWLSIELANEPVAILDKNGSNQNSGTTMRDFFQPIVDKIRANGYKGIIWVPGGTWQQEYKAYSRYPISDPLDNYGYAVHWYPGWYGTSDKSYDNANSLKSFIGSVPVVKTHPVMITEVDWSPEDPNSQGKYNEWGEWVLGNYGTWGTGSTSKFGKAYKYVYDYLGNCGMTLTHTHDYMDIDHYLATGVLRPAFSTRLANNAAEACSGACFQWYKEYAHQVHDPKIWESANGYQFDESKEVKTAASDLNGKTLVIADDALSNFFYVNSALESPQNVRNADLSEWGGNDYKYLMFTKIANPGCSITGNFYTIRFMDSLGSSYNVFGSTGHLNTPPGGWCLFALGLTAYKYGQDGDFYGLWKVDYEEGKGYVIQNVGRLLAGQGAYLTPTSGVPVAGKQYVRLFTDVSEKKSTGIVDAETDDTEATILAIYDTNGRRLPSMQKGMNILKMSNGKVRKVLRR